MSPGSKSARRRTVLTLETLEGREVPATLAPIADFTTPNTKAFYVPLTVTNVTGTVQYTATSSNAQVQAEVVQGGTTLRLDVSGTDASGAAFSGPLTFRLFDSLAPVTVARIVDLVNQGFYDGLTFHRVIDGFVAQGGDPNGNGSGGSGQTIDDEFNTLLTFNSPGLLAMAKSTDDTGDSQFFVTDIDVAPLDQPQYLNFNHTIFGQLVAGFDTFNKLIRTPVGANDLPLSPVTITSAAVVADDPNGVLRVTAPANFTGASTITVTPSDAGTGSTGDSFDVNFVADTVNDPPFLGPVPDLTTTAGTAAEFSLTSTDLEGDPVTYSVTATSGGQTIDVNPRIDQATGRVTVTPPEGFVGTIDLLVGGRDTGTQPADTQAITLTVTGGFDLEAASDTGVFDDDNITGRVNPRLLVTAAAGQTVSVSVNGTAVGTAAETSTPGRYQITIPPGRLQVGTNTITGTAGSTQLTAFTLTYAPSLREAYVVPGTIGVTQQITFQYVASEAAFQNEFGYFRADDTAGTVNGLSPGDAGYAEAALARRQVVFARGAAVGTSTNVSANGGDVLVPYIVQDGTSEDLVANNPSNATTGGPVAFFGPVRANPDGIAHVSATQDPQGSRVVYSWEDLTGGGDRDYNDMVVTVRRAGDPAITAERVPGGTGRIVPLTATFRQPAKPAGSTATPTTGEVGVIPVDNASGGIGTLNPGDDGWAAAALGRAQVLFGPTATVGQTTTLSRTGGEFIVYYFVPGGTAAGVAATNPTNSLSNGTVAYFSLPAANPDDTIHTRSFGPDGVTQAVPADDDPITVHVMGSPNGTRGDFDDAVFTVGFGV